MWQSIVDDLGDLPFTLIADTDAKVIKAFGQAGVKMATRQAYLIKDGKIVGRSRRRLKSGHSADEGFAGGSH